MFKLALAQTRHPPHPFQLIETRVKAMKTEMSDNSLLLRSDQRKPEAVLRELRAKARGLRWVTSDKA